MRIAGKIKYFLFLPYLEVELYSLFYLTFVVFLNEGLSLFKKINKTEVSFPNSLQASVYVALSIIFLGILVYFFLKSAQKNAHKKGENDDLQPYFSAVFFLVIIVLGLTASVEFVVLRFSGWFLIANSIVLYLILGRAVASLFATFILPEEIKNKEHENLAKRKTANIDLILIIVFGSFYYSFFKLGHFTIATIAILGYFYTAITVLAIRKIAQSLKKTYGQRTTAQTA